MALKEKNSKRCRLHEVYVHSNFMDADDIPKTIKEQMMRFYDSKVYSRLFVL